MLDRPDEAKDGFLTPETIMSVERIASVRGRMEEDALTAEVVKVLRSKGWTVIPPGSDPLGPEGYSAGRIQ